MKIAIEGCAHGELDMIYETVQTLQEKNNFKIDLLICCGDFQAVRNVGDLKCMAVPDKYLEMNTFYKYYSGIAVAPVLTLFIGGNHEASNYLAELGYGGWVAPNIYFLGYAGVVKFGGIRIAGLSGIYKGFDYLKGRHECPPYNDQTKRTVYHIRNIDVFRLKQIDGDVDIGISHDWPRGIHQHGDVKSLLKAKRFFENDINDNKLGSRPTEDLLNKLKPTYWFAAHLHVKFAAIVHHKNDNEGECKKVTKFLSLDKCLPHRKFLQIIDVDRKDSKESEAVLEYDRDWLCILKSTSHLNSARNQNVHMPGPGCSERYNFKPTSEEMDTMDEIYPEGYQIPQNFSRTSEVYEPDNEDSSPDLKNYTPAEPRINPQTTAFCQKLDISDPMAIIMASHGFETPDSSSPPATTPHDWTFVDASEVDITLDNETTINLDETPVVEQQSECDVEEHNDDVAGSCSEQLSGEIAINFDTPVSSVKRFKRRNQAMYKGNDSNGDE